MVKYDKGEVTGMILLTVFITLVVIIAILLPFGMDNYDIDDIGEYMCAQEGYNYEDTEMQNSEQGIVSMKVICNPLEVKEESLADGYLVLRE